jgi:hypothetical protein
MSEIRHCILWRYAELAGAQLSKHSFNNAYKGIGDFLSYFKATDLQYLWHKGRPKVSVDDDFTLSTLIMCHPNRTSAWSVSSCWANITRRQRLFPPWPTGTHTQRGHVESRDILITYDVLSSTVVLNPFSSWPTSEFHSPLWPHPSYSLIIKNNVYNRYVLYQLHFLFITYYLFKI